MYSVIEDIFVKLGYIIYVIYMSWAVNFWMVDTGLMLDPLFSLISRLYNACFPLVINLQINLPIGIKDIPF